ncbi:FAD-binding oxidoreductase [Pyruvatibacter sp.]|uniref:FAD-binding oxidoreductase n=1 Tax=Pyruvatibacter sp. TaxID=1981328 RepID=UPI0032EDD3E4
MTVAIPSPETLKRLAHAAGPGGALVAGHDDIERYLVEWRGIYRGTAPLVLRPASTQAVADIVRIAHETRTALVPQGGNTGLVGGQIPDVSGAQIVVSLERMKAVHGVDALNNTVTVDAGCTLAAIQDVARENDRLFPLSLASEGSCQIGGVISTNAGGTAVLRYGSMRSLVLGLEAVLPDGRIWNGLSGLRKDNTGYDLTALLAGAEGTLGIITRAVLKLFPAPKATETAFIAVRDPQAAVELLVQLQDASGGLVSTFEIISRQGFELVLAHFDGAMDPLSQAHEWYVLAELTAGTDGWLRHVLETSLATAIENEMVADAVIAESETQRMALWALRENMSEAQKLEGASIKHDVSVPVSQVPAFLAQATQAVTQALPGVRPVPFGHIGDGNIHFNLSQPRDMDGKAFLDQWQAMNDLVHGVVASLDGSISAEHGIGTLKRDEITRYKSDVALDAMRAIKKALDPHGIMNPGKLI